MKGLLVSTAIAIMIAGLVQWSLKGADACTRLFMLGVPGVEFCMLEKKAKLVEVPRLKQKPGHDFGYEIVQVTGIGPVLTAAQDDNLTIDEAQRRQIESSTGTLAAGGAQ